MTLLGALVLDVVVQGVSFLLSYAVGTEKYYDLSGSLTNMGIVLYTFPGFGASHIRQILLTSTSVIWAARLGSYLFRRILQSNGHDGRFDGVRNNFAWFGSFWAVQAVWIFTINVGVNIVNLSLPSQQPALGLLDYVGLGVWTLGMSLEVLADYQKSVFRSTPGNENRFISHGLWSWSRHPNYFGEIMLWWGSYMIAFSGLSGWGHLAIASPLFVTYLLSRVSGVPMMERHSLKKFGKDPAYRAYLARTSILIPLPPKSSD